MLDSAALKQFPFFRSTMPSRSVRHPLEELLMQPQTSPVAARLRTAQIVLALSAALAYIVAVASGTTPALGALLLSMAAIAALAMALFALVAGRVAGPAARRGARAESSLRHYRRTAALVITIVYVTLAAGALVANENALRACLALPICATDSANSSYSLAQLAMAHRALAAIAALAVGWLAAQTWRLRPERPVRRAVIATLALMAAQVLVGMLQVLLASDGTVGQLMATRGAHLAIGVATWSALIVQVALALYLPQQAAPKPLAADIAVKSPSKLKDYISLTKPGVITLLILTTVASMYITPAGMPPLLLVFWTFVGGWLMASGAHAVNCWADQDIDINMGRTSRRPIPSGRIPAWHALVLGIVLGVLAFAILAVFVNLAAALLSLAGYFYYVLIYTRWLKRTTPSNIVIGGGAGAFPPLVGWAAATGGLTWASLLLFAIIFYWTPPHFWALALIREKDYARASVPMLPVVAGSGETKRQIVLYTVLMLLITILPAPLHLFGLAYLVMALVLGAIFLRYALLLWRDGTVPAAWALYKFSLLYLALLWVAMVLDRVLFV